MYPTGHSWSVCGRVEILWLFVLDKDIKDTTPTVGYEPHDFKYGATNLKIYDLGGGSRFRDVWKHYLAESYGFIYVIDASNRNRINECRSVFSSFVENEKVAGKPILM